MGDIEKAFVALGNANPNDDGATRAAMKEVCAAFGNMLDRFIMAIEAIEMNTRPRR